MYNVMYSHNSWIVMGVAKTIGVCTFKPFTRYTSPQYSNYSHTNIVCYTLCILRTSHSYYHKPAWYEHPCTQLSTNRSMVHYNAICYKLGGRCTTSELATIGGHYSFNNVKIHQQNAGVDLIDSLDVKQGSIILDLGCWVGNITKLLAERLKIASDNYSAPNIV